MVLKIRLRQQGKSNHLTFRLVLMNARCPRDGRYIEMLGHYDPFREGNKDAVLFEDRIQYWVEQGAQLTEKAESLVARVAPGVMKGIRERKEEKKKKNRKKKGKKNKE